MSPEAIFTVDAKASCCVLRSLALIKYTFRRWADLRTPVVRFLREGKSSVAAYVEVQEPRVVGTTGVPTIVIPSRLTRKYLGSQSMARHHCESCRFEQSFSPDGGKARDVNWIATDARIEDESDGMAMGPPDEPMMNTL